MIKKVLLVILFLFLINHACADSNGIWTYAEDIVPGTFGSDEGYGPFTFNGIVNFLQPVSFKNNVKVEGTLNVSSNSGRAIWAESSVDDGVAGVTSAADKSAIYGWAKNSNAYSGYFEGGKFYVGSINITLASKLNCGKLYTDANGNVWCGVDQVNDADADPTNELQVLNKSGNIISLSRGGGTITLNDDSPTNELQTLSISGNTLSISNGNSVTLPDSSNEPAPGSFVCIGDIVWDHHDWGKVKCTAPRSGYYRGIDYYLGGAAVSNKVWANKGDVLEIKGYWVGGDHGCYERFYVNGVAKLNGWGDNGCHNSLSNYAIIYSYDQ